MNIEPVRRASELVSGATATTVRRAQNRLGKALRDRVAGEDAPDAAKRIWQSPGPRWFTEDDPIWIVNQDAAMFPGGIASLLLQLRAQADTFVDQARTSGELLGGTNLPRTVAELDAQLDTLPTLASYPRRARAPGRARPRPPA